MKAFPKKEKQTKRKTAVIYWTVMLNSHENKCKPCCSNTEALGEMLKEQDICSRE